MGFSDHELSLGSEQLAAFQLPKNGRLIRLRIVETNLSKSFDLNPTLLSKKTDRTYQSTSKRSEGNLAFDFRFARLVRSRGN